MSYRKLYLAKSSPYTYGDENQYFICGTRRAAELCSTKIGWIDSRTLYWKVPNNVLVLDKELELGEFKQIKKIGIKFKKSDCTNRTHFRYGFYKSVINILIRDFNFPDTLEYRGGPRINFKIFATF